MISVTFRGQVYQVPEPSDAFNQALTDYLNALSTGAVPFPTTADIDLGAAFGIKALDFKTRAANPAASGLVRSALADVLAWRNNANNADLALGVGGQDQLQWRGSDITGNPMLNATTAAGQSIPTAVFTIVVFGTVVRDSDSAYVAGTGRFTVPTGKGGDYVISAGIEWNAALTGQSALGIFKNAAEVSETSRVNPAATDSNFVAAVLPLVPGDIIDIRAFQNSAGAVVLRSLAVANFISIKRIPV